MAKGTFFIVIGPSGVGKTTIVDELLTHLPRSCRLVTCTSRAPREGEVNGEHYHFLDRADFERRIAEGEFLETNEYAGNLYGSSASVLDDLLDRHVVVLGILDVNGAVNAKARYPEAVTVFVRTEDMDELERRIRARSAMDEDEVRRRLETAREEVAMADEFDHIVVNRKDALEEVVRDLMEVVFPYQFFYPRRPPKVRSE